MIHKEITVEDLFDNFERVSNNGNIISVIDGESFVWYYKVPLDFLSAAEFSRRRKRDFLSHITTSLDRTEREGFELINICLICPNTKVLEVEAKEINLRHPAIDKIQEHFENVMREENERKPIKDRT